MTNETSIYKTLGQKACVNDSRKLGIAYIYAVIKSRESRNNAQKPIIGEAQIVYGELSRIGPNTLAYDEELLIERTEARLAQNKYIPLNETVDKLVTGMCNDYGIEPTINIVGDSLQYLLNHKPNFKKPIDKITSGKLNRHEQKAIKNSIEEVLNDREKLADYLDN